MVDRPLEQKRPVATHWLLLAYLVLLAVNVWLLWLLPTAPAIEKVSFMLAVVGIYNLVLNFLSQTDLFKAFPSLLEDMTSPNFRDFAAGALRSLAIVSFMFSLFIRGFPPPVVPQFPLFFLFLIPLALGTLVGGVAFMAAYLVVITPLAYIGYLLAAIILDAIENAPNDFVISSKEEGDLTMQGAIRQHRAQLRMLVVGLPATVVGVGTTAYGLFL